MTAATQAARPVNTGSRVQVEPSEPQASTSTNGNGSSTAPVGVLKLRGTPKRRQRVMWSEGTIDNEGMGKKSSKICCIYHKPKAFDQSSSESSSDSSSDSDNEGDSPKRSKEKPFDNPSSNRKPGRGASTDESSDEAKGEGGARPTRRAAKHKHRHAGHRHPHDENCSDKPAPKANKYDMPSKKAETKPGVLPTSR